MLKPKLNTTDIIQNDVFQAEKILQKRTRKGETQYKIKWYDYPVSQATWEPVDNIIDKRLIDNYEKRTAHVRHITVQYKGNTRNNHYGLIKTIIILILFFISPAWTQNNQNYTTNDSGRKFQNKVIPYVIDCSNPIHQDFYKVNEQTECTQAMHNNLGDVETYTAKIQEYSTQVTNLELYLCSAQRITLTCWENFLTKDTKKNTKQKFYPFPKNNA